RRLAEEYHVELTLKALQVITHNYNKMTYKRMKNFTEGNVENYGSFKNTKEVERATEITLSEAKTLGSRIIIFQSPTSFSHTDENIRRVIDYFSTLDKSFIYGWEPRGSWSEHAIMRIIQETNIVHVVDPFKHKSLTKFKYYRLHGIGKGEVNYSYKYTDEDLSRLKEMVINERGEVYVLFNNVHSFDDALKFKTLFLSKQ
ncbi:DUF72 domain-containing protein, partial [Sulfolobus sp. D5]